MQVRMICGVIIALSLVACESQESGGAQEGETAKADQKETCVFPSKTVRVCCPAGATAKLPDKDAFAGGVTTLPFGAWCDGGATSPIIIWQDKTRLECPAGSTLKQGTFEEDDETGTEHFCDKGGSKLGPAIRYHESGAKMQLAQYVEGKLSGETTRWHENGMQEATGQYGEGQRDGLWTHYDDQGNKNREENWKAGKRHGASVAYWDNGNKRYEMSFEDNQQHGPWTNYWYDGGKQESGEKNRGKTVGTYTSWWGSGQMASRGEKVSNWACADWECWQQDGTAVQCWEGKKPDPEDKFADCKGTKTGATCPPCDKVAEQVAAYEAELAAQEAKANQAKSP